MRIEQTKFSQRRVIELVGSLTSPPYDFFDLYNQVGIATSSEIDVQAVLGVLFFAECAKRQVPLPAAKKSAFGVVPEGTIFLASDPSCWHVHGSSMEAAHFIAELSSGTIHARRFRAQDLLNIRSLALKRFLAELSDGAIHTSNDASELFGNGDFGSGAVIDMHGLAKRLRSFHNGALFKASV